MYVFVNVFKADAVIWWAAIFRTFCQGAQSDTKEVDQVSSFKLERPAVLELSASAATMPGARCTLEGRPRLPVPRLDLLALVLHHTVPQRTELGASTCDCCVLGEEILTKFHSIIPKQFFHPL